jgi:hypothetical protein
VFFFCSLLFWLTPLTLAFFTQVPPIVWQESPTPVIKGTVSYVIQVTYDNPCRPFQRKDPLNHNARFLLWCKDLLQTEYHDPINESCSQVDSLQHPSPSIITAVTHNRQKRVVSTAILLICCGVSAFSLLGSGSSLISSFKVSAATTKLQLNQEKLVKMTKFSIKLSLDSTGIFFTP